MFATQDKEEQKQFAVQEDKGKFLFAAGAPKFIGAALSFKQAGDVRFRIESVYPGGQCSGNSRGKAQIVFSTPLVQYLKRLDKSLEDFVLPIRAGDTIDIRVINEAEVNCGRAMIWLSQDTNIVQSFLLFPLIWFCVLVLLAQYKLGFLAIWGAGFQALYIVSDTYYDQAVQTYMGSSLLIALFAVGLVLGTLFARPMKPFSLALFTLVSLVLLGLPLLNIGNYWLFESTINTNSVRAILETDFFEWMRFLVGHVSGLKLILFCLVVLTLALYAIRLLRKARTGLNVSILGVLLFVLSASFVPQINEKLVTVNIWTSSIFSYVKEAKAFEELEGQRKELSQDYEITRVGPPRTTIMVIAESQSKNHMSIYGYPRETTPSLKKRVDKDELIVLRNAYSSHIHSTPSLPLALTQANQNDSDSWSNYPSIIDLARQSGIQTFWLSNRQVKSNWSNQVGLIAQAADELVSINEKSGIYGAPDEFDKTLLTKLRNIMETSGEKLIVLHLKSNDDKYCGRYPKDWVLFSGNLEPQLFGQASQTPYAENINCYDSSIAYNDHILDTLFSILETSSTPASVFYFSDRGRNPFTGNTDNPESFDFSVTEIPSLIWASKRWKQENVSIWEQLSAHQEAVFTSDLVFETTLSLMGLDGEFKDLSKDMGHTSYRVPLIPVTLHGRKKIYSPENRKLWQKRNGKIVTEAQQSDRLLPHRVNTIGKMRDIVEAGITSFEIDIRLVTMDSETFFEVGHGGAAMSGMRLEEFLAEMPNSFQKIWLDVKNVSPDNIYEIISELNELDSKYQIKSRTIVETGDRSEAPKLLADEGYHVSYYLPTVAVLSAANKSENSRQVFAEELAKIAEQQHVSAVSFDLRLYGFVKTYLEPLLDTRIDYHTWFPGVNFGDSQFLEKLGSRPYFDDERVETILLPYSSAYSL